MKHVFIALIALTLTISPMFTFAQEPETVPQQAAEVFFTNVKDGDTLTNPISIVFGISGMGVVPAGTDEPGTGHFHLLIDTQLSEEERQYAIPKDDQHIHFGKGQTETELTLTPGEHTLQLVMGDGGHMLHNPPVMSSIITVTVAQ